MADKTTSGETSAAPLQSGDLFRVSRELSPGVFGNGRVSSDDVRAFASANLGALKYVHLEGNLTEGALSFAGDNVIERLQIIGDGDGSFTSIDLTGCTSLQQFLTLQCNATSAPSFADCPLTRLDMLVWTFLAGSLDLSAKTLLERVAITGTNLTSLDLSGLSALAYLDAYDNTDLTTLDISGCDALLNVDLSGCSLTQSDVDAVLVALDANGLSDGSVNIGISQNGAGGANSSPSATGLAARASLEGKGWSVTVKPEPTVWSSTDKSSEITLSDGDLRATHTAATTNNAWARATQSRDEGGRAFTLQIRVASNPAEVGVGLVDGSADVTQFAGDTEEGAIYYADGSVYANGSLVTTLVPYGAFDAISVQVDYDAGKIWFGCSNADPDFFQGGDPSAGTGAHVTFTPNTPLFPAFDTKAENDQVEAFFDQANGKPSEWEYWDSAE